MIRVVFLKRVLTFVAKFFSSVDCSVDIFLITPFAMLRMRLKSFSFLNLTKCVAFPSVLWSKSLVLVLGERCWVLATESEASAKKIAKSAVENFIYVSRVI